MIFSFYKEDMMFQGYSKDGCTYKGKPLESRAKLFCDAYHTHDKGYWHGSEGYFLFRKNV